MELAETIRFALKATKELESSEFHSQKNIVAKLGVELGHDVAGRLAPGKKKEVYAELASFWIESGLGRMVLVQPDPLVIRLSGCSGCDAPTMRDAPVPCTLRRSLLETILQDTLGTKVKVKELECCKNGGAGCIFRLRVG
jgi:predicted hydrocarbon binding protein